MRVPGAFGPRKMSWGGLLVLLILALLSPILWPLILVGGVIWMITS